MHTQKPFIKTARYYLRPVKRIPLGIIRRCKGYMIRCSKSALRRSKACIPLSWRYYIAHQFKHQPEQLTEWTQREKTFCHPLCSAREDSKQMQSISTDFLAEHKLIDRTQLIAKIQNVLNHVS